MMTQDEIRAAAAAHGISVEEFEDLRSQIPDISKVLAQAAGQTHADVPLDICPICMRYNCPADPTKGRGGPQTFFGSL